MVANEIDTPEMFPGDVLFFHSKLLHKSGNNMSEGRSRMAQKYFRRSGTSTLGKYSECSLSVLKHREIKRMPLPAKGESNH